MSLKLTCRNMYVLYVCAYLECVTCHNDQAVLQWERRTQSAVTLCCSTMWCMSPCNIVCTYPHYHSPHLLYTTLHTHKHRHISTCRHTVHVCVHTHTTHPHPQYVHHKWYYTVIYHCSQYCTRLLYEAQMEVPVWGHTLLEVQITSVNSLTTSHIPSCTVWKQYRMTGHDQCIHTLSNAHSHSDGKRQLATWLKKTTTHGLMVTANF